MQKLTLCAMLGLLGYLASACSDDNSSASGLH